MAVLTRFLMNRLNLSPLPCVRLSEDHRTASPCEHLPGFVDDSVIMAILKAPGISRSTRDDAALALSADELDFAGWNAASALPS
jgi:hypothetical protein